LKPAKKYLQKKEDKTKLYINVEAQFFFNSKLHIAFCHGKKKKKTLLLKVALFHTARLVVE
jgi:hypothetical protein